MAQLVERQPLNLEAVGSCPAWARFFHMFVPTLAYTVGAESSYLGLGREGNSKTAQPYSRD